MFALWYKEDPHAASEQYALPIIIIVSLIPILEEALRSLCNACQSFESNSNREQLYAQISFDAGACLPACLASCGATQTCTGRISSRTTKGPRLP